MGYDDGYGRQGPNQGMPQFQFPPFTGWVKRLIIINFGVFLGMYVLKLISKPAVAWLVDTFAMVPPDWTGLPPIWQLITSGFMHSLRDPMHVAGNMLMLYFFGSMVQSVIGSRKFVTHYVLAMIAGAVVHLILAPLMGWKAPVLGASGAVSGMVVAAAVLNPQATVIFIVVPVRLWILAAFSVAMDLFHFVEEIDTGIGTGIAHSVHLGGALYGFVVAKKRWIDRDPMAIIERKRAVKAATRRIGDDARMDALMVKIGQEGIGSLTRSERAFMQKQSERKRQG